MISGKKILAAIVAIVVLCGAFAAIYNATKPAPQEGSKSFTLFVDTTQADGFASAFTSEYKGTTDAEYLRELMDELQDAKVFSYEGSDTEYGLFITAVNGLTADYEKDGAYWAIIVNDEYGQYGADQQVVNDGDCFKLVYEKAQ